jgi:hypothetical protein
MGIAEIQSNPDQRRSVPSFARQPEPNASKPQIIIIVSGDNNLEKLSHATLSRALVSIGAPPAAKKDRQRAIYSACLEGCFKQARDQNIVIRLPPK